jgi:hypothetical protein
MTTCLKCHCDITDHQAEQTGGLCSDCAEWDYLSDHCSIDGPGETDCDGACPDFDDTRGKQDDH